MAFVHQLLFTYIQSPPPLLLLELLIRLEDGAAGLYFLLFSDRVLVRKRLGMADLWGLTFSFSSVQYIV